MTLLLNILGIIVVIGGLYLFSENKNKVNKKLIAKALLAQFIFAFLLVKFPLGQNIVKAIAEMLFAPFLVYLSSIIPRGRQKVKYFYQFRLQNRDGKRSLCVKGAVCKAD